MENLIEAVKLIMAISAMAWIGYLLIRNMILKDNLEYSKEALDKLEFELEDYYKQTKQDISDIQLAYENKIDKLEEVIHNLENNKKNDKFK